MGSDRYSRPSLGHLEPELAKLLPHRDGVFVEAGAYDGYWQSNTYWLERFRGWTGVLVEPVPELAALARRERPRSQVYQCALVDPDDHGDTVRLLYGGTMSLLEGTSQSMAADREHALRGAEIARQQYRELSVPARTLTDVLTEARLGQIDLLSLDVEGREASVLRGLDLDVHAPRVLLVEMLDEERNRPEIEELLNKRYRYGMKISFHDHVYLRIADA
jgi:FkbM family methyltransferase